MAKLYAKAPDGSDALLSIVITGFTQSLQQNGWCKLPNSLIFQWRRSEQYNSTWTFNISYNTFLTACLLGFFIEGIGRQHYSINNSYIRYTSELRNAGHTGTIAIGY